MNKSVSCGDFLWDRPYATLPASLQAYMLADVRFGHICYNVLMACLLLEMFPDPETCCRYTATSQDKFVEWFTKVLISKAIAGVEIYPPAKDAATTREELILSLHYRDEKDKLAGCPDRIKAVGFLLHGRTPTICFGGPRWLHVAREHFILQHHLLVLAGHSQSMFAAELTKMNRCYIRFGRSDMYSMYWEGPVPDSPEAPHQFPISLLLHPDLVSSSATPDFDRCSVFDAFRFEAERTRHPIRFLVAEWLRLDPLTRCPIFIGWFDSQDGFYDRFKGLYEYACQMFSLSSNRDAPSSPATEALRARIHRDRISREQAKLARAQEIVQNCQAVVDKLKDPFAAVDQDIMSIPTVSLPGKSGIIAAEKVVVNKATKGRDLSEVAAGHSMAVTTDHVARTKPWSSYKRYTVSQQAPSNREPYYVPRLLPSFRMTRFLEVDERMPVRRPAGQGGQVRQVDQNGRVTISQPSMSRPMTQDEYEEYNPLEDHWMDDE